jgi:hypothetical protein
MNGLLIEISPSNIGEIDGRRVYADLAWMLFLDEAEQLLTIMAGDGRPVSISACMG